MHSVYHDRFIGAIHNKTKIKLTFYSHEDGCDLVRLCAPMDYGIFRAARDGVNRYHLWDYESDKVMHNLAIVPENIVLMEFLTDTFEPSGFITWTCKWFVKRDWGHYS
jgi:hypothetical protein